MILTWRGIVAACLKGYKYRKLKTGGKADVTSAAIAAYLNLFLYSDWDFAAAQPQPVKNPLYQINGKAAINWKGIPHV
jgi:hypothetical protein